MSRLNSPNFLEIVAALRVKRGHEFEVVCNDYLKAGFPSLTPRVNTIVNWTMSGTPDAFLFEHSGDFIAFQHGPQDNWSAKLFGDAKKVAELAEKERITVRLLVFCTAAEVDLSEHASAQRKIKSLYGFNLEICDVKRLADDLEKLYPGIAYRRLGIPIRLERLMSIDTYLDSANKRYWPKRRDLHEKLLYWPEHYIKDIEGLLVRNKRCLLTGASGSCNNILDLTRADYYARHHLDPILDIWRES
jgi:hypothetical protein